MHSFVGDHWLPTLHKEWDFPRPTSLITMEHVRYAVCQGLARAVNGVVIMAALPVVMPK